MEMQFEKRVLTCLEPRLCEIRNGEETLEIRLPEGMPDVGKIVASWGQPILRSKQWHTDRLSFSGGMMVWVLYLPEREEQPQCLQGWIPYTMGWDLPPETEEGTLRIDLLTRFVDARTTSARKIMVRSGLSAAAEGWTAREAAVPVPGNIPRELQLLQGKRPLRLIREAGEKAFQLTERLTLPPSAPKPDKLLTYLLTPAISEKKVVANKLVFRGGGNLHILYADQDGQLHCWDFPLAFSQYAQLEESYGTGAWADVKLCTTALEAETDPEGAIEIKSAVTAQYLVSEQELVETVEDAYAPGGTVRLEHQKLSLPVVLDAWEDSLEAERSLSGQMDVSVDTWTIVDRPRQRTQDGQIRLEFPGQIQMLCYGADGNLSSASGRFEGKLAVKADPSCLLSVQTGMIPEPQLVMGADSTEAEIQIPVRITAMGMENLEVVCAVSMEHKREADREGPSLIIRRAGKADLWEIAKATGSTMEAIRKANSLEEEPSEGQLLLIPVR